jgi:hypothetical protein
VIVPVPLATAHVTALLVVPEIPAANCCCHLSGIATVVGEMVIETTAGSVTLTVAEADLVASAALTAVTV